MLVVVTPGIVDDLIRFTGKCRPEIGVLGVLGEHAGQRLCQPIQHQIQVRTGLVHACILASLSPGATVLDLNVVPLFKTPAMPFRKRTHGGRRPGAGRPPGVPTVRLRIPENHAGSIKAFLADEAIAKALRPRRVATETRRQVPMFVALVPAGFPSPAEQYIEEELDLTKHLIPAGHEASTFIIRVSGWSMIGAGIFDGDEIVVDRAHENPIGKVVVASHNGSMTIKRLRRREGNLVLLAENPHYPDRVVAEGDEFAVWGVVVRVLHVP